MLADDSNIRPGLYRLPDDPVGPRVLIPGFKFATSVRGAFGWFSAGWVARLAPGLAEYLNRPDAAPIEFTVSPYLFPHERAAIECAHNLTPLQAQQRVCGLFTDGRVQASALTTHALDCLAWMIAKNILHLRVAVPTPDSNYHPKIWLFADDSHQVLARGSGNATGRGVGSGVEHLDVDVTWVAHSRARVCEGVSILDDWCRARSRGIDRVIDISEALREDIIRTAPVVPPTPIDYLTAVRKDRNPGWAADPADVLRDRFGSTQPRQLPRLRIPTNLVWTEGRYAHQGEAVTAWEGEPRPEQGTISMATGAGKTITALICATRVQDRLVGSHPLLIVISAPSIPLLVQWQHEVSRFGIQARLPSREPRVDIALADLFRALTAGGTHVAIVTNNLLCSKTFQSTVARKVAASKGTINTLFIGDEAHTLGSVGFLNRKPEFFDRRLALSATPTRQYDPDGTEGLFAFFGPPVYEFGLDAAIGFCLCPYNYYVHACTLDSEELSRFNALTRRIATAIGRGTDAHDDTVKRLLIARRRIVETAHSKLSLLQAVLTRRKPRALAHALIYASSKDPNQFTDIAEMLTSLKIRWAPVTQETTSRRRLLDSTLRTFDGGGFQVLLAKKVLDEGVDIPSIREAFIVASSTVEREWVQRRGRVLRLHPAKPWAIVHDFLALPPTGGVDFEDDSGVKGIVRRELDRAYSFAGYARNAVGAEGAIPALRELRNAYWSDGASNGLLENAGDIVLAEGTPRGRPW